jgi:uncharacterized protein YhaN
MRLKRLSVASFGKLPPGLELYFKPGLNLILAPNEAGKTTTLELISCLLFGFGKRKGGIHPYEPWANDAHEVGAELAYELADQREFKLGRHLLKRGERLNLQDSNGSKVELAGKEPGELHLGLSKGVFQTVSRIQLDDLHTAFSGDNPREYKDVRQELMGLFFVEAATRGEVRNPVEVRDLWANEAAALFHTHGNRGRADKELNDQLANAENSLVQAKEREEQARQIQTDLEALVTRETELTRNHRAAAQELERIRNAMLRAREQSRKAELEAKISELVKQGLVEKPVEQSARDLEREIAAAEERSRQSLTQSEAAKAKADDGDPSQDQARLATLESRLTVLEAQEQEADRLGEDLGRGWVALESEWDMEVESLAGLQPEMPFRLHEMDQALRQAKYDADQALRYKQNLPPAPRWALALGMGVVAVLAGIKGMLWCYFASWPWWAWAGAGILAALGVALGLKGRAAKSRAKKLLMESERLDLEAEKAAKLVTDLQAELESVSAALSPKALSAPPSQLAAAMMESTNLLDKSQKQAESLTRLASEREEMAQELAGLVEISTTKDWRQAINKAKQVCQAKAKALEEAKRLEKQAEQENASARKLKADLGKLLSDAGLADTEALRQAGQRTRKSQQLRAALIEVEERLKNLPASELAFADLAACQAALEGAEKRVRDLQGELNQMSQRRGRLEQELAQLNRSQSAAQAEAVCDELRRQRWELARRHGVLLLAGACLERAMQRFRLEAQPSLLQKASNMLGKTSAGAYQWLGSDIFDQKPGQDPELSAKPGAGSMERQSQALSRGTRDQLYLSLRLALAQEITDGQEPVPLLMDDPLVNFDDERMASSLDMLVDLASERQVILFTCHRTQYDYLRGEGNCNVLELS